MTRLRLGFDPVDIWDREDFRNVIKEFVNNPEVDVYLVTKSTSTSFVNSVVDTCGMSSSNVYQVLDNDAVQAKLDLLQVRIYMAGDYPTIRFIDAMSDWAVGVLVNDIVDNNKQQMKYITKLQFWINEIARQERNGQTSC